MPCVSVRLASPQVVLSVSYLVPSRRISGSQQLTSSLMHLLHSCLIAKHFKLHSLEKQENCVIKT